MGQHLLPGGLLIEGTSDPFGQVWVANLVRKQESGVLVQEGLLFSTNFRQGFAPEQFQPVLPKNFIHRVIPGEPIEHFFRQWQQAYRETLPYRNGELWELWELWELATLPLCHFATLQLCNSATLPLISLEEPHYG